MVYKNLEFFFDKNVFFFNKKFNFLNKNTNDIYKKINKKNLIDLFYTNKKYFLQIDQNFKNIEIKNNLILNYFSISKIFKS